MKLLRPSAAAFVLFCALLSARPAVAEVKSTALQRGKDQVEGHQSTIALFMHPTSSLRSIAYQGYTELDNGNFCLEYAFNFRAWYGRPYYSSLLLTYFANGSLDSIALGERSCLVPPFMASNIVLDWFKDRVAADPAVRSDSEVSRQLADFDSRQLLEWVLKAGW